MAVVCVTWALEEGVGVHRMKVLRMQNIREAYTKRKSERSLEGLECGEG